MKYTPAGELGIRAIGRKELVKADRGESLTRKEAILAQCYACMSGYEAGKVDCRVAACPLYRFMPYRNCEPRTKRN